MAAKEDFVPTSAADLTDIAIVPRLVRLLAAEMKQSFELLNIKIDKGFAKLEARLDGHDGRIAKVEQVQADHGREIAALAVTVRELDRARKSAPKSRKRR
jgi:hypothetical protein